MPKSKKVEDSTDNCYLTYSDELEGGGYLICSYNHEVGETCLMDKRHEREWDDAQEAI